MAKCIYKVNGEQRGESSWAGWFKPPATSPKNWPQCRMSECTMTLGDSTINYLSAESIAPAHCGQLSKHGAAKFRLQQKHTGWHHCLSGRKSVQHSVSLQIKHFSSTIWVFKISCPPRPLTGQTVGNGWMDGWIFNEFSDKQNKSKVELDCWFEWKRSISLDFNESQQRSYRS